MITPRVDETCGLGCNVTGFRRSSRRHERLPDVRDVLRTKDAVVSHWRDAVVVADAVEEPIEALVDERTTIVAVSSEAVVEHRMPGPNPSPFGCDEALARLTVTDVDDTVVDDVAAVRTQRVVAENGVIAGWFCPPTSRRPIA